MGSINRCYPFCSLAPLPAVNCSTCWLLLPNGTREPWDRLFKLLCLYTSLLLIINTKSLRPEKCICNIHHYQIGFLHGCRSLVHACRHKNGIFNNPLDRETEKRWNSQEISQEIKAEAVMKKPKDWVGDIEKHPPWHNSTSAHSHHGKLAIIYYVALYNISIRSWHCYGTKRCEFINSHTH